MQKVLIFVLAMVLIFSCVGCGTIDENDISSSDDQYNSDTLSKENSVDNSDDNETVYASDKLVNRFINEFNDYSNFEMGEITKGNIRTKFFAYANDCYIEMINANDATAECFSISINGGKEITERDKMFKVATDVIKVLDPTIDDSKIIQVITYLESEEYMVSDYKITDNVIVKTYVPIVELSYGKSDCRIDIISNDYK
ncbi:MAG: hypothetical protein IJP35_00200 [Clostridia bacterium]|nr:hypothetical protein [Clostridia bacterium]